MYIVKATMQPHPDNNTRRTISNYLHQKKFMNTTYWDLGPHQGAHTFRTKKEAIAAGVDWRSGLNSRSYEIVTP